MQYICQHMGASERTYTLAELKTIWQSGMVRCELCPLYARCKRLFMTNIDWSTVKHFNAGENWGDVNQVHPQLVYALDLMRSMSHHAIHLSPVEGAAYATSGHAPNSYHYKGMAADVFSETDPVKFAWVVLRTPAIRGIGLYPYWSGGHLQIYGGWHLDIRPAQYRAVWWQDRDGVYRNIDAITQLGYVLRLMQDEDMQ